MPIVTRGLGQPESSLASYGLGLLERVSTVVEVADSDQDHLSDEATILIRTLVEVLDADQGHLSDEVIILIRKRRRAKVGTKYITYKVSGSSTVKVSEDERAKTTKHLKMKDPSHSSSIQTHLKRKR